MGIHKRKLTMAVCLLFLFITKLSAEDWPHWRGPNRNGIVGVSSGWPSNSWKQHPPKWKATVGQGSTSPVVIGESVYVMGWRNQQDILSCLEANSGKRIWTVSYSCPRYGRLATGDEGLYSGPTSTPEYDAETGYLYSLSCDGDLNCWDTARRGQQVWNINLHEKFTIDQRPKVGRSGRRDYGYTTAPLVHKNWVIVEVGANEGTLMAFDKSTGKQVWKSEATVPAGHTGALVPIEVEGIPCVAVMTFQGLLVTRIDGRNAGKTVAAHEWVTDFANNIVTPVVHENHVLITSGYNQAKICKLEITFRGAKILWEQKFSSKICTPVIHKGHVYWSWQRLRCLDYATGKQLWEGGRFGDAGSCIVTADDRLIVWGGHGTLALVETAFRSPTSYQELASINSGFKKDVWPHVVLANSHLYCKDRDGNLICYEMSVEK